MISSQNGLFTSHILFNDFLLRKISDLCIFSGFFQIFMKSLDLICFLVYSAHEVGHNIPVI